MGEENAPIFDELASTSEKGYLFVFTDFNMDKKFELSDEIRGIGWGREVCPTTGKEHLQGMIQVYKQSRFKAIIKLLGGNCWVKAARGTIEQCKEYCSKEGLYTQYGNFVRKGQKMQGIIENYEAGNSIIDIIENDEATYLKYHSGIDKIYMHLEDRDKGSVKREMTNMIIWGDSGIGKTTSIYNKHGRTNCYMLADPQGDNKCWNGYTNQKVLILDEFYSWLHLNDILRLLDGHPYQCRGLCKSTYASFTHVYLTLNEDPLVALYPKVTGEKRRAFFRRFKKCLKVVRGNIDPHSLLETKLIYTEQYFSDYVPPMEFIDLDYEEKRYEEMSWYERRLEDIKKTMLLTPGYKCE